MTTRTSSFLAGLAFVTGSVDYHAYLCDLVAETGSRLVWGQALSYMEIN